MRKPHPGAAEEDKAMAGKFEWREEYCLGVKEIDREHQQLFRIVNKLFEYREQEKDRQWTCR